MKIRLVAFLLCIFCNVPAQWTQVTTQSNPGPRDSHNMVWDNESKRAILYGSHSSVSDPTHYDATWAFDPSNNTWTKMNPSKTPGARAEYGLVYCSVHDKAILFGGPASVWPGGTPGPDKTNDLWAYDYNTDSWEERSPAVRPDPVGVCRIGYDSESDKVIYFEGSTGKTWAFDYTTTTWQNMNPPNPRPASDWRAFTSITYDSKHDRIIMLTPSPQVLWVYDYNANRWEQRAASPNVPIENGGLYDLDYDINNDKVLLYGDNMITWIYDWTTNAWTNMNTSPSPEAHHHAIAFMPEYGKMLFYGGHVGNNNQTWEYVYEGTASVDRSGLNEISYYPNPAFDKLQIMINERVRQVRVLDIFGDDHELPIMTESASIHLNTSRLPAGSYQVRLDCNTGESATIRFIKLEH